jgi:hypothetical protein
MWLNTLTERKPFNFASAQAVATGSDKAETSIACGASDEFFFGTFFFTAKKKVHPLMLG